MGRGGSAQGPKFRPKRPKRMRASDSGWTQRQGRVPVAGVPPRPLSWGPMRYKAVLFDLGGVVVGSPLAAIARYEAVRGIRAGFRNRAVVTPGAAGAWARLERGDICLEACYPAFEAAGAAAG